MFTIVEDYQQTPVMEIVAEPACVVDSQCRSDDRFHVHPVGERCKLDEPAPVGMLGSGVLGNFEGESRLSGTARTDDCDQAIVSHKFSNLIDLCRPAYERAVGRAEIAAGRVAVGWS